MMIVAANKNMESKNLEIFRETQSLQIDKTSVEGIYMIRESLLPMRARMAEKEKKQLIHQLFNNFNTCAVWLDNRFEVLASTTLVTSKLITGLNNNDWCGWFVADEHLIQSLALSPEGGWACAFFDAMRLKTLEPISPLPTEPEKLGNLRDVIGSEILIYSELDDEFWLIVFSEKARMKIGVC
jgi:hypothetical protein